MAADKSPSDVSPLTRLKYRAMSHLPGRTGLKYLRKLSRTRHDEVNALFDTALAQARGKTCIDLGANMGVFTRQMADVAAEVIAFEPDPWTAEQLRARVSDLANVKVIEAAAGSEAGHLTLYRSPKFAQDPRKGSLSSTLIAEKTNVTDEASAQVEVVDFCAFLEQLDRDIALLKIDIEGGEVALLEHLLDHPVLSRIDYIFVETHETKLPTLAPRSRALRRRVKTIAHPVIDLDWQ